MPTYVLYDPSEGSHVDATTLITGARSIYEGDFDNDSTSGDDVVDGGVGNIWGLGGTTGTELGFGKSNPGTSPSADKYMHTLFKITLPEGPKATASGAVIQDSNTTITKVVLKFKVYGFNGSGSNHRIIWSPIVRSPSAIDYDAVTWQTSDGTVPWAASGAKSTGDVDTTSDFGMGTAGLLNYQSLSTGWNSVILQDTQIVGSSKVTTLGFDWGTTINVIGYPPASNTDLNTSATVAKVYNVDDSAAANKPYVEVYYQDDPPEKPLIQATPGEDFRNCKISLVEQSKEKDLVKYIAVHNASADPAYNTGTSGAHYGTTITDTNKEYYDNYFDLNQASGTLFFPGSTSVAGTANKLIFWAEDNNNTGASGATQGNTLSITRYQPYTSEDPDASNFAKSCSCSWIIVGKATAGSGAASLTDTTSGTTEPWLRGNFVANGVELGDTIYNIGDKSGSTAGSGTVATVTDTTITATMTGGTSNNWDTNDEYVIVRKIDIGEKVSMTIRSTRISGLKFDKIGVWWTSTTNDHITDDINVDLSNFDIIELDNAVTEHTLSYRYVEAGSYYPQFFFVDSSTGFRTAIRQAGRHTDPDVTGYVLDDGPKPVVTVQQPKPVPRLTSSKSIGESANVALDRSSAVVYSAANSTASGADAYVKNYKWLGEYVSGQILTQGSLDIDNTPLVNESKKLYMRCNTAAYNDTVFTIYGLASFTADNATPVKDTATTFSHYRYVKATVSPGSAKYLTYNTGSTFGDAARTDPSAPDTEVFFKQVDFIYCTTRSSTAGTEECYQLLAADSDNDGTIDVSGTLDISTICKRLVIDSNNASPGYKWGGLCTVTGSSDITFTKNSGADEIESTAIDFIAAGFGPGDTITVEDSSNDGVYTIQKVEKVSSTYSIYLNEELSVTEASTSATIFTTQPAISVAAEQAGTPKISLNVTNNLGTNGDAAVNIYTTFRDQTYLDLNASADSGYIAIQNASLTRSGGISAAMPLGERRYPPGAAHTKHGLPKMSMTVRVVDSTGFNRMYRLLNNSYNYAVYQHHDTSFASWVKYRLKMESFTVNRDPQNLQHQVINLSFFIVGEEV